MSAKDDESLLLQYEYFQEELLLLTEDLGHVADEYEQMEYFTDAIQKLQNLILQYTDIKKTVVNINIEMYATDRSTLQKCLVSDERVIIDTIDLLKRRIQLHDLSPIMGPAPPNLVMEFNVIEKFNVWADTLGVLEFRNVPYNVELDHLLNIDQFEIKLNQDGALNRIDCAGLILQALIRHNIKHINFSGILTIATPLMQEKLKCLLHYVLNACEMLQDRNSELSIPITILKHTIDPKTIALASDHSRINVDDIQVDKYVQYHRYQKDPTTTANDYTIIYVKNKVGQGVFDDAAPYESIWYMRCPEMYVLPKFINHTLGYNESYAVRDIKQYNVLTTLTYTTKRALDAESYRTMPMHNFLMYEACDNRVQTESLQNDLPDLNREIAKLMSGVSYEQIIFSGEKLVFRGSPFICSKNRTFQFLIELLVCLHNGSKYQYCASNYEQQTELNNTRETLRYYTISQLYNKLSNYNPNLSGTSNLYRESGLVEL
jgi:hypothetical protein